MTTNHLEKDGMPCSMGGFGLGFEVIMNATSTGQINSEGAFRWGGMASTTFFCDPAENMFVVMMSALRFRNDDMFPLTPLLKQMVYACIDDDTSKRRARTS